ncbi:hypothetical protein B484DRAFT_406076 [Ochromonadaceae sp. CCMP2298]|nr:hypothetical protein B484DRAFT_406076 [Ochromonadaceae sp. CCMP2298]
MGNVTSQPERDQWNGVDSGDMRKREAAVSAMNLTFRLPDGVSAMIMEYAQDFPVFQDWDTKLTILGLTAKNMIQRESTFDSQETHAHPQSPVNYPVR